MKETRTPEKILRNSQIGCWFALLFFSAMTAMMGWVLLAVYPVLFASESLQEEMISTILFGCILLFTFCFFACLTISSFFALNDRITLGKEGIEVMLHPFLTFWKKEKNGFFAWDDVCSYGVYETRGAKGGVVRRLAVQLIYEEMPRTFYLGFMPRSGKYVAEELKKYNPLLYDDRIADRILNRKNTLRNRNISGNNVEIPEKKDNQ